MSIERLLIGLIRNTIRASERARNSHYRQKVYEEQRRLNSLHQQEKERLVNYVIGMHEEAEELNKKNDFLIEYVRDGILRDILRSEINFSFQDIMPTYEPPKISQRKKFPYQELGIQKKLNALEKAYIFGKCFRSLRKRMDIQLAKKKLGGC